MAQNWSHVSPDVAEKVRTAWTVKSPALSCGVSYFKLPLPRRGLRFIQVLLQSLADGEKDPNNPNLIKVNVIKAYEQALKKYHGWVVQKIFSVSKNAAFLSSLLFKGEFSLYSFLFCSCVCPLQAALCAAPYRSNFLKALSKGEEVKEEDCLANVRQFLVNYTATVDAIYEMYTSLNAELDYTV